MEIIFKNIITKTDTLLHPDEFPSLKNLRCISVHAHKYTKAGPEDGALWGEASSGCPSCLEHHISHDCSLESPTPFKLKLNTPNKFLIVGSQSTGKLHFTQVAAWELSS